MLIGYHIVKTAYGRWLPGDERGHWSAVWDDRIGQVTPGGLQDGNAEVEQFARSKMRHPPVTCSDGMIAAIEQSLVDCAAASSWQIAVDINTGMTMHLVEPLNLRFSRGSTLGLPSFDGLLFLQKRP